MRDICGDRGASALVLSGELTEGVSDLSHARTAPGGVPALREVNQDRSHPDSPQIEEQPHDSFRRLVSSGGRQPAAGSWDNLSNGSRTEQRSPGPAQKAAKILREQSNKPRGGYDATGP